MKMNENEHLSILLIEDDPNHVELIRRTLHNEHSFWIITVVETLQAARDQISRNVPNIIIADLRLPDGSASELLTFAKEENIPLIVITSQGDEQSAVSIIKSGAADYIVKSPEMFRNIPRVVERILREWEIKREREQAAIEKHEREIFLETILATTNDGYWLADLSGNIVEVNDAYCKMVGYSKSEMYSMNISDLDRIEDYSRVNDHIQKVIREGSDRFESIHRCKDGRLIDVEVSTTYLSHEGGRFVCFIRDVTERNRAEREIRDREQEYRQLIDTTYEGIWIINFEYRTLYINNRMIQMLGFTDSEEFQNRSPLDLLFSEDQSTFHQQIETRKLGQSSQYELRFIKKDGSILYTIISASPYLDENRCVIGTFGMITDITEQKATEFALKRSEERFRKTFDLSPVSAAMLDRNFKFVRCNETFCQFLGYTENELIGKSFIDITSPEDIDVGKKEIQDLVAKKIDKFSVEKRYQTKEGQTIWALTTVNFIADENGNLLFFLPIIQNIHNQKLLFETIKEREAKLNSIFSTTAAGMGVTVNQALVEVNQRFCEIVGREKSELISQNLQFLYPNCDEYHKVIQEENRQIQEQGTSTIETRWMRNNGDLIEVLLSTTPFSHDEYSNSYTVTALDITERNRAINALKNSESQFRELVHSTPNSIMVAQNGRYVYSNPYVQNLLGYNAEEFLEMPVLQIIHPRYHAALLERIRKLQSGHSNSPMVIEILHKKGYPIYAESTSVKIQYNNQPAMLIISKDITDRVRIETINNARLHLLEYAPKHNLQELLQETLELACQISHSKIGFYHFINEKDKSIELQTWSRSTLEEYCNTEPHVWHYPLDQAGVWIDCIRMRKPVIHNDYEELPHRKGMPVGHAKVIREATIPVFRDDCIVAVLGVGNKLQDYNDSDVEQLVQLADLAWDIAERKRVEEALQVSSRHIEHKLKQLKVLHDINLSVIRKPSIHNVINSILDHIYQFEPFQAVILAITDEKDAKMEIMGQRGLPDHLFHHDISTWGTPHMMSHLESASPVIYLELNDTAIKNLEYAQKFKEVYNSLTIMPLSLKNNQNGIILLLSQSSAWMDEDWHDFLHSLAMQSSIAIENARMINELQCHNIELKSAYEAILQGWANALELRDKETKGHSDHVTRISVKLAQKYGVPEEELENFRRGVLMHDIGKMGIPDSILLKPGPLSADEWVTMRQHPKYAFDLLSKIPDFQKFIDIPYCHHEKWDGSGYPRGLKGEEIPIGARLFTICDVWDALNEDRPYRPRWPINEIRAYIIDQAGKHFDPRIVSLFIQMLDAGELND